MKLQPSLLYITTFLLSAAVAWAEPDFSSSSKADFRPSDSWIRGEIRSKFFNNDLLPLTRGLQIEVLQGHVILSGRVGTDEEYRLAGKLAATTAGVTKVINNIEVRPLFGAESGNQPAKPAQETVDDSGFASTVILTIIKAFVFVLFLLVILPIVLWRTKRREDRQAFADVLGQPSVKTYFSPGEYKKARERRQ